MSHETGIRISGFIGSVILTLIAYFIILYPDSFTGSTLPAPNLIFFLALVQSVIQLVCFIDVWQTKDFYWNLSVFISTASIIFIIIFFSIWIINHLNYNMH